MKRREFVALVGGATAWPLQAIAQQTALPIIGFLHLTSRDETRGYLPDFHEGLADLGYVDGKNVLIEYRWGEGHNDRLPGLIADLVRRQVSVIVTLESTLGALAAKEATQTIPVIFMQGADPVRIGLACSRARDPRCSGADVSSAPQALVTLCAAILAKLDRHTRAVDDVTRTRINHGRTFTVRANSPKYSMN